MKIAITKTFSLFLIYLKFKNCLLRKYLTRPRSISILELTTTMRVIIIVSLTVLVSIPHPNIWKLVEIFQKEEFLLVQVRCERLKDGSLTSVGERKCDLKRNIQILQAKKKYLRSRKTYEDLLLLFESGICAVQNFELD